MSALCNEQRIENIRFAGNAQNRFESMGKRKGGLSMDHMFTLTGTTLTVHLPSEVDHHSTELLQREMDQLIQSRNIRCILFDFGDTVFMDSSGIGMLLGRYKMIRFVGGTMAAINVKERMRRVLLLSGVYKVIDIYEGLPQQSKLL